MKEILSSLHTIVRVKVGGNCSKAEGVLISVWLLYQLRWSEDQSKVFEVVFCQPSELFTR